MSKIWWIAFGILVVMDLVFMMSSRQSQPRTCVENTKWLFPNATETVLRKRHLGFEENQIAISIRGWHISSSPGKALNQPTCATNVGLEFCQNDSPIWSEEQCRCTYEHPYLCLYISYIIDEMKYQCGDESNDKAITWSFELESNGTHVIDHRNCAHITESCDIGYWSQRTAESSTNKCTIHVCQLCSALVYHQ